MIVEVKLMPGGKDSKKYINFFNMITQDRTIEVDFVPSSLGNGEYGVHMFLYIPAQMLSGHTTSILNWATSDDGFAASWHVRRDIP